MLEASVQHERPQPETIRELFCSHGLRYTSKRACVYEALASTDSHPTAQELLVAVHLVEPKVSLATVYNTLEALVDCGLCRCFPGASGSSPCRYDADVGPHVHVIAADGRVMDVPSDLSSRILAELSLDTIRELEHRLGITVNELDLRLTTRSSED